MVTRLLYPPLKAIPMAIPRIFRAERRGVGLLIEVKVYENAVEIYL